MSKHSSFLVSYSHCRELVRTSQQHARHQQRWFRTQSNLGVLQLQSDTSTKKVAGYKSVVPFDEIKPTDLGTYMDTEPPSPSQLKEAAKFFARSQHSPVKLFSAAQFRTMPIDSNEPEVAFLGRSNIGKSSLINAIVDDEICRTGNRPGKTTEMNAYGIGGLKGGQSRIVLLDMPGYGKGSRVEQGEQIMKYLQNRKQLRRTYILIDLLHGLKDMDRYMLSLLRRHAIPHQLVVSKVDRILCKNLKTLKDWHYKRVVSETRLGSLLQRIQGLRAEVIKAEPGERQLEGPPPLGDVLCCTAMKDGNKYIKNNFLNIDSLRWSIMQATGFDGMVNNKDYGDYLSPTTSKPEVQAQSQVESQAESQTKLQMERTAKPSNAAVAAQNQSDDQRSQNERNFRSIKSQVQDKKIDVDQSKRIASLRLARLLRRLPENGSNGDSESNYHFPGQKKISFKP